MKLCSNIKLPALDARRLLADKQDKFCSEWIVVESESSSVYLKERINLLLTTFVDTLMHKHNIVFPRAS